jgi:ADP-heptose:LPS heptosyltransferase
VLVVFPGALGDLVCLVPVLRELGRRHGSPPVLFCKEDLVPLVSSARLAEAEPIERRETSWLFSPEPPPHAAAFFSAFSTIESFTGASVPEVERNLKRWTGGAARVHPFRPSGRVHLAEHFLRSIGASRAPEEPFDAHFEMPAEVLTIAAARWHGRRRPLLVVQPGSGGYAKRWSRAGFERVAQRWVERGGGIVVLLGAAEGSAEARAWRAKGFEVASGMDLVAVAALLVVADAYLGNDSGVSHLASALGARGVALFGPTDPQSWGPLCPGVRAVALEPWSPTDEHPPSGAVDAVEHALELSLTR